MAIQVSLKNKPIPLPTIYSAEYKLIILLFILKYCARSNGGCNFLKLHLYMWSLRSDENYNVLLDLKNKVRANFLPWSFEPGLDKTVALGLINDLCLKKIKAGELQLYITDKGANLIEEIERSGFLKEDVDKIKRIGYIPQSLLNRANSNWILDIQQDV